MREDAFSEAVRIRAAPSLFYISGAAIAGGVSAPIAPFIPIVGSILQLWSGLSGGHDIPLLQHLTSQSTDTQTQFYQNQEADLKAGKILPASVRLGLQNSYDVASGNISKAFSFAPEYAKPFQSKLDSAFASLLSALKAAESKPGYQLPSWWPAATRAQVSPSSSLSLTATQTAQGRAITELPLPTLVWPFPFPGPTTPQQPKPTTTQTKVSTPRVPPIRTAGTISKTIPVVAGVAAAGAALAGTVISSGAAADQAAAQAQQLQQAGAIQAGLAAQSSASMQSLIILAAIAGSVLLWVAHGRKNSARQ